MNWTNGEHAMALKVERERVRREMSIELADWQASSEAYRLDAEQLRAEIERLLKQVADLAFTASERADEIERLRDYSAGLEDVLRRSALEPKP